MKILINVWLTVFGPITIVLGVGAHIWLVSLASGDLPPDYIWKTFVVSILALLTAWDLFRRIWQKSCDTKLTRNRKSILPEAYRVEPTI